MKNRMMNRIEKKFLELKKEKKKALVVFVTAGDPSLLVTEKLVLEFEKRGADIIELGVPFSDPIADGPTIQASSDRSLGRGTKLRDIIKLVGRLRPSTQIPVALMTYYNPVLRYGLKRFVSDCGKSGVDGVIIPDLPADEAGELISISKPANFATIFFLSPTSSEDRFKMVSSRSKGFIYYVSLTGITGARESLPNEVAKRVRLIKTFTRKPICVGFGVSSPEQVRDICKVADGVIVGSAVVKMIEKLQAGRRLIEETGEFIKILAEAAHQ
ncbi:MAG: tryptophan synthase subunit alpha [Candidatus Omnitrophota bacterium]